MPFVETPRKFVFVKLDGERDLAYGLRILQ